MKIAEPLNSTGNPGDGLGLAVGEAHRRYTNFINVRGRRTGHLFQSRFASVAMEELHRSLVLLCGLSREKDRLVPEMSGDPEPPS
jgi:hypothetical protein